MTIRWLAFLSCALISLPFTPAATAQTQAAFINSPTLVKFDFSSNFSGNTVTPTTRLNRSLNWNSEATGSSATTLSASASGSSTVLLGAPGLWIAQDAIPLASTDRIDTGSETPAAAPDMSNCRWTIEPADAWSCKIKPLSRHEFPIRKVGHYLWPLHRANSQ